MKSLLKVKYCYIVSKAAPSSVQVFHKVVLRFFADDKFDILAQNVVFARSMV